MQVIQLREDRGTFDHKATFDHPYPTTKVMWIPDVVRILLHASIQQGGVIPMLPVVPFTTAIKNFDQLQMVLIFKYFGS